MAHARRHAAFVVVLALAAACTSHGGHQTTTPRRSAPAVAPTLAGDKRLAEASARRLLGLARVPEGALLLAHPPRLASGAFSSPTAESLVDLGRTWTVPLGFDATVAWERAHPPVGLGPLGTSSTSHWRGHRGVGLSVYLSDTNEVVDQRLEIQVVSNDRRTSFVRADAQAVWVDPHALRDAAGGPRVRVTISRGCPRSVRGLVGVRNPGQGLTAALLPNARPTSGVVCAYGGVNARPPTALRRAVRMTTSQVVEFAVTAQGVPVAHVPGQVSGCPNDDGRVYITVIGYAQHPDVDLWLAASGCTFVGNGFLIAENPGRRLDLAQRFAAES